MNERLKKNTKLISDMECDIDDIKTFQDFENWFEKALELTSSIWGKSSAQYIITKNIKNYYTIMSLLNSFNMQNAINDAREVIEICEEGFV